MGFFTKDEEKPAPGHPPENEPPTKVQIVFPTVKNLYLAIYVIHQIFYFENSFMINENDYDSVVSLLNQKCCHVHHVSQQFGQR